MNPLGIIILIILGTFAICSCVLSSKCEKKDEEDE